VIERRPITDEVEPFVAYPWISWWWAAAAIVIGVVVVTLV
jgi:hypothetical protein